LQDQIKRQQSLIPKDNFEEDERVKQEQKNRKFSAENISSTEASSEKASIDNMDRRELVLLQKERKRKEEQERIERELKEIRIQNYEARR
jgi:hypothetical protein